MTSPADSGTFRSPQALGLDVHTNELGYVRSGALLRTKTF